MRLPCRHPEGAGREAACHAPEDVTVSGGLAYDGSRPEHFRVIGQQPERQQLVGELEPGPGQLVAGRRPLGFGSGSSFLVEQLGFGQARWQRGVVIRLAGERTQRVQRLLVEGRHERKLGRIVAGRPLRILRQQRVIRRLVERLVARNERFVGQLRYLRRDVRVERQRSVGPQRIVELIRLIGFVRFVRQLGRLGWFRQLGVVGQQSLTSDGSGKTKGAPAGAPFVFPGTAAPYRDARSPHAPA